MKNVPKDQQSQLKTWKRMDSVLSLTLNAMLLRRKERLEGRNELSFCGDKMYNSVNIKFLHQTFCCIQFYIPCTIGGNNTRCLKSCPNAQ